MNRVNAIIALLMAAAVIAGWFLGKVNDQAFFGMAGAAITYFFPKAFTQSSPILPTNTPVVKT